MAALRICSLTIIKVWRILAIIASETFVQFHLCLVRFTCTFLFNFCAFERLLHVLNLFFHGANL